MKIRVFLCDDHAVLRDGLKSLLHVEPDMEVVGEANHGGEALEGVVQTRPDVVLLDINMPVVNGIDAIEQIRELCPETKIIMLTMYNHDEYLFRAIQAGAHGYLLKDAPIQQVIEGIRNVVNGGSALHPELTNRLLNSYRAGTEKVERLSPREQEVLMAVVEGLSNKEIGERLYISETTVKLHITNLYRKLNVKSRSQAIMVAVRHHLVPVDSEQNIL